VTDRAANTDLLQPPANGYDAAVARVARALSNRDGTAEARAMRYASELGSMPRIWRCADGSAGS
jgi:hypothetical protein